MPVSSVDLPETTRLRARLQLLVGERKLGLEVVARKTLEGLVVVALAPDGTRLFAVVQRGRDIEIDPAAPRRARQLALVVIDVLHRGLWIEPKTLSRNRRATSWIWEDEEVEETQRRGRRTRTFRHAGETSDVAPVSIAYRESRLHENGSDFEIRNAWCGYEAVLVHLDEAG